MAAAPEKIWAFHDGPMVGLFVGKKETGTNVSEYVRSDIAERQLADARAERDGWMEELGKVVIACPMSPRYRTSPTSVGVRALRRDFEAAEKEVERLRLPEGTVAKHGSTITIEFDSAEYAIRAFDALEYAMSGEPAALGERP